MLRKTDIGTLNPLALDTASKLHLATFLKQNPKSTLFSKYKNYSFISFNPDENISHSYKFKLSHDIIARQRKPGKNKDRRYEVMANREPLGEGGNGIILISEGVLILKEEGAEFKAQPRAIKQQNNPNPYDTSPDQPHIELTKNEYKLSLKVKHLHMKPPAITFFESQFHKKSPTTYLAMDVMPGKDLRYYTELELLNELHLTASQRIALSIAILRAIKEQAHQQGLIHRDIKPENIMVNLVSNEIKLIDFSYSKDINDPESDPGPIGSIITMPPEQFIARPDDMPEYTLKSDSYAAGKSLAELWRAEAEVNLQMIDYRSDNEAYIGFYRYAQHDTNFDFTGFLYDDLDNEHAAQIKNMLLQLTRAQPDERWSLDQAIQTLEIIQEERKTPALIKSGPGKSQLGF